MKLEKQVLTLKNDISQLKIQPESQLNEITSVEELEKQVKQLQAQLPKFN
ncbi:21692_t:CDS:2 [Gigaspora margarita]|uniref:21692_t:CDS:1 n=1 Tax=Gigaspora margarita TaxID=4874 RepID=A0ABM8VVF1_GIGMA|nr:21692_t:CDS:2 [Gigaspora margarita]